MCNTVKHVCERGECINVNTIGAYPIETKVQCLSFSTCVLDSNVCVMSFSVQVKHPSTLWIHVMMSYLTIFSRNTNVSMFNTAIFLYDNVLFGNLGLQVVPRGTSEGRPNDHRQAFIYDEKQNSINIKIILMNSVNVHFFENLFYHKYISLIY